MGKSYESMLVYFKQNVTSDAFFVSVLTHYQKKYTSHVFPNTLTLLHSEQPKLHVVLAVLSAIGLNYTVNNL